MHYADCRIKPVVGPTTRLRRFCRAMLSAAYAVMRCRVSVTFVSCVKTNKDIDKLLSALSRYVKHLCIVFTMLVGDVIDYLWGRDTSLAEVA